MNRKRWLVCLAIAAIAGPMHRTASAEPINTWPLLEGIDCLRELYNPIRPDGTRDPNGDPEPGSPEWIARDDERLACDNQRDSDRRWQPPHANYWSVLRYGEDFYRVPQRFDDRRFRFTYLPAGAFSDLGLGIPGVMAAEIYRPCAPGTCGDLPAELERFEPPYPVVVVVHGAIANMTHHRFNGQVYAEAGYMAIVINSVHPAPGAPDFSDHETGDAVLQWLHAQEHPLALEADLNRVAFAGHSQGAGVSLSFQGDPRVHTIVAWDGGDSIADRNCTPVLDENGDPTGDKNPCQPIMYQRTDGAFSAPQATARTDYPENRDRGLATYTAHKERDMDVFHMTLRGTNHIDWNGNGVGILAGNRLAEPTINYYTLAWLDRHLKGKLIFDGNGDVVTTENHSEDEERAYRQALAQDAYDRLVAQKFPKGSIDKHNISMGFYDPVQLATSGDPVFGGNAPYTIEETWTTDRLSPEYRSFCHVTVPDYVGGDDGVPGDGVPPAAVADSGADGDVRLTGCPEVP